MNFATRTALLGSVSAALLLAACGSKDKTPAGQVVATVDGKDVTVHELNGELQALGRIPDSQRDLARKVALQRVIERKMLVDEAVKRGLDKTPQYIQMKERAGETLLVQALQQDVATKVGQTTREGAQKFVADNPTMFGDRKVITLDQIQFLKPANYDQLNLKGAKTMAEVEKILVDANIEYRRAPAQLDTLNMAPQLAGAIAKMSAGANAEPFLVQEQPPGAPAPIIFINNVTSTKTMPFTGEKAIAYAQQVLQRQEIEKQLKATLTKLQADTKGKIVYAKGYGPPALPAAAPAAPAAAAPAAAAPAPGTTAAVKP